MIKQIDRVTSDLVRQVEEFRKAGGNPICVGFLGINYSDTYPSHEGERSWPTDGKKYKHPIQQAAAAEQRLRDKPLPSFYEFLLLRFRAANVEPYRFQWLDYEQTAKEYAALLVRVSRMSDQRFGS